MTTYLFTKRACFGHVISESGCRPVTENVTVWNLRSILQNLTTFVIFRYFTKLSGFDRSNEECHTGVSPLTGERPDLEMIGQF